MRRKLYFRQKHQTNRIKFDFYFFESSQSFILDTLICVFIVVSFRIEF